VAERRVAQQARDGLYEGLDGKSPWQAYADRLIERARGGA
jgi:hypothetical protein